MRDNDGIYQEYTRYISGIKITGLTRAAWTSSQTSLCGEAGTIYRLSYNLGDVAPSISIQIRVPCIESGIPPNCCRIMTSFKIKICAATRYHEQTSKHLPPLEISYSVKPGYTERTFLGAY